MSWVACPHGTPRTKLFGIHHVICASKLHPANERGRTLRATPRRETLFLAFATQNGGRQEGTMTFAGANSCGICGVYTML